MPGQEPIESQSFQRRPSELEDGGGGEEMEKGVVRYGIVGVGMMGREHMVNLAHLRTEGAVVTCVADLHPPSLDLAIELARSLDAPLLAVLLHA